MCYSSHVFDDAQFCQEFTDEDACMHPRNTDAMGRPLCQFLLGQGDLEGRFVCCSVLSGEECEMPAKNSSFPPQTIVKCDGLTKENCKGYAGGQNTCGWDGKAGKCGCSLRNDWNFVCGQYTDMTSRHNDVICS
eukprot:UN27801